MVVVRHVREFVNLKIDSCQWAVSVYMVFGDKPGSVYKQYTSSHKSLLISEPD